MNVYILCKYIASVLLCSYQSFSMTGSHSLVQTVSSSGRFCISVLLATRYTPELPTISCHLVAKLKFLILVVRVVQISWKRVFYV